MAIAGLWILVVESNAQGMTGRQCIHGHERIYHGDLELVGEAAKSGERAAGINPAPGEDHGARGLG